LPPVATSLADPAAPDAERAAAGPAGAQPEPPDGAAADSAHPCANCGAQMEPGQDWCLQCGAGAPGSLPGRDRHWRSGAGALAAAAVLALGAGAAAYAALSKGSNGPRVRTATVAQAPAPATVTPTPGTSPATPASPGTPTTIKPAVPVKPPKIPLTAVKPAPAVKSPSPQPTAPASTPSPGESGGSPSGGEPQPSAILLDTNAAATYNPYAYPAAEFGDPSLTIDGDSSTGWTAQVDPGVAPRMAEGVVLDLKSARKLKALVLVTSTPGMTVQAYGANGAKPPASITDPGWVKLTPSIHEKGKHARLKLRKPGKAFRFVTLWISKAPPSAVGTPTAPGRVSVNELELFPAA
jgi:hypothetical protein